MTTRVAFACGCLAWAMALAPARADIGDNEMGINTHLSPDDIYDAAAALNVGWVRLDNNWFVHEPREGQYDWRALDQVVDAARARGLKVFMTIAYAPAWASEADNDDVRSNNVPRAGLYERYVTATVERYRDRVTHYGLWNESNLRGFFEGTLDQYVDRILIPGAQAIVRACPTCKRLGPDTASAGDWRPFLGEVVRRARDHLDIVTHHSYARVPEARGGWLCDDFDHAIDIGGDAICFYKPGTRQVLDDAGWQGEVWMTEVGYRAEPWDSDGEQQRQVRSAQGILRMQLSKPWWTNTFFYEILDCRPLQPDCNIDGFGFLRRTADPDGTWEDNFVVKPVFAWLRDELANNPVWRGEEEPPPPPPPPPPRIDAPHRAEGDPDGSLAEWDAQGCVVLERYEEIRSPRAGNGDLTARGCAAWSDGALWLAVEVVDEVQDNDRPDDLLWQGDSVQLAIDVDDDAPPGAEYDDDDLEVVLARVGEQSRIFTHHGEAPNARGEVRREGERTRYELRVPLGGLADGRAVRASFLVNDADGDGREGWLEWTPGIGRVKEPALFGEVVLSDRQSEPSPDAGAPPPEDAGREPPPLPDPPDVGDEEPVDDGGVVIDPDDGVPPVPDGDGGGDARSPRDDRGVSLDDGGEVGRVVLDAGAAGEVGSDDGGCNCRAAASTSSPFMLALLLGLPVALRARRRRGR